MLFNVSCELEYATRFPSTLILNIQAQRSASQTILSEEFSVSPRVPVSEFALENNGNRFLRLEATVKTAELTAALQQEAPQQPVEPAPDPA